MTLTALPALVVGISAASIAPLIGGLIAAVWLVLVPLSLYKRWASLALPFVAGALLVLAIAGLTFNSPPFTIDFWTAVALLILGLPRRTAKGSVR
jgi:hypothetical protein